MEAKKSRAKYWMYFCMWLTIIIILLAIPGVRPFFWLALPGVVTYFSLAMNIV